MIIKRGSTPQKRIEMHNKSVLRNSFFLIFTFMIVEAVFGFVSNSFISNVAKQQSKCKQFKISISNFSKINKMTTFKSVRIVKKLYKK